MLRFCGLVAASVIASGVADAQGLANSLADRGPSFEGVYVGITVGLNSIIGGALVDGVDYLAQDSRPTVVLFAGWRRAFDSGLVLGVEGGIGLEDGNLRLADPARSLNIDYRNNFQWRYGGMIGWRTSDRSMLFSYLSETKRDFDVNVRDAMETFTQKDGQGLLRYGLGAEFDLDGPFDFRATVGSSRADFGDRLLSRKPDNPIDFELGALSQF